MIVHYVLSFQNYMILQEIIIMSSSYIVKDINLAGFGKKEILIAETEMPGLVATVDELGGTKTFKRC